MFSPACPSLALIALLPALAVAQPGGSIAVVVRDSSGAPIPGVTIRIVAEEGTDQALDAVSDAQGALHAAALAPGRYRVEARLEGFDAAVRRIAIEAGMPAVLDLTLNPSRLSESVV